MSRLILPGPPFLLGEKQQEMQTPIFWLISQEARVKLIQFQWDYYGTLLDVPPEPFYQVVTVHSRIEDIEEIDRIIRRPPKHPVRVK